MIWSIMTRCWCKGKMEKNIILLSQRTDTKQLATPAAKKSIGSAHGYLS